MQHTLSLHKSNLTFFQTSSTPLVIIGDTLVEESERIAEKKCSDVCSLYESRHEYASYESCNRHYGEDYEYEDDEEIASEALQEAFEKCIEMFKEPKNMENLQHLLNLADLLDSLQVDFISEGKITELTENVDNELIGLILEMSLNQTLDGETLKNISTECLKHRPLDEVFLKIPENWLRLFDGEQIDEPKEVIELRYDLLTNSERFQEALFIVKNYPSPEILHKHLKLTLAAAKENPDSKIDEVFQTMDHIHSLSSHDVVGLNCVEQLNKMIQIVPSARKPDGVALLLKFLKKEGYNSVLSLIAANGTKEDVENSISVINTKLSSSSEITPEARRKLFKCLFKEVASLHPITFDRIFSMGLREVGKNWSNDLFDLLLKQCQQPGRRKPSAEIKIVQFLRNMNRGAISSNTILEKVISTFTGTCPELLSQVADVIIDRFDPYPHFQLLVASGSMLTMKKFLQKYEMDRGLTRSLNSTSPTTIVLAIMENLLPRFPTFRGELIAFFVKCFKADPVIFQEEMCPLFSSESDLLPIMSYIEEKTAFGQRWIQELPSIIRKLLKLAIPKAWNGIKESCMSIVTEQFAHDPQSWASFVLKYGTNEDASKAASALSECIQSQPEKANDTEMFNLIYSLVSKLPNKWPQAVEHVKKLLQVRS